MAALSLKEFYHKYGTGCPNSWEQCEQIWNAATKYAEENCRRPTSGVQPTSGNTASFQLPLTMESCIEHLRTMWGDIYITAEVRCAVEETHDYIERQLQTLL